MLSKYLEEELNFLIDMLVENGHERNYLNYMVNENKHQAPKTENIRQQHSQNTMDTSYRT